MNKTVVLISKEGMDGRWKESILRRAVFLVHCANSYPDGFQLILRLDCDLVVVEEWPGAIGFQTFLAEVELALRKESLKFILLTNGIQPGQLEPPFNEVLPVPFSIDDFNRIVAETLGLGTRAGRRYIVHLHLAVSGKSSQLIGMATTVQLNAGGMIVESIKALPMGKLCFWTFSGVSELKNLAFPGTIFLEDPHSDGTGVHRYVVRFESGAARELAVLAHYLAERF